ncbi:hypothetical protein TBR22_A41810 [Luteitalea sp. TBR-22]|uniref:class I SAM-dependent methyltransferase n=1 Tax=Luteitalea sp. TBR-22 TaxID=2802971 RepID=UPI001AFBFC9D|nr:class I SAM-dependent methyltransferase [Luteitalea sp. TBR-22]BCS34955.1 hypothetical protein TBR22_A41810 [Luteitalea sp. TBR-22]
MSDPLAGSPWSAPATVQGFVQSPPNATLIDFARRELVRAAQGRALDIGCGAARNALPLADLGWDVLGVDLSRPMVEAARARAAAGARHQGRLDVVLAAMDALPAGSGRFDLIVAQGIWNLARSSVEFRAGVREAARVAARGAALFVFTFSRRTLPADAQPLAGEAFVFTQFSGQPQCFLTREQLVDQLGRVGFEPDHGVPWVEHNAPPHGTAHVLRAPVIHEAAFRVR